MKMIYKTFFGYLLDGEKEKLKYALEWVKPEYFIEPFFKDLIGLVYELYRSETAINYVSICDAFVLDDPSRSNRIAHARLYFNLPKSSGMDEIVAALQRLCADCTTLTSSGSEFESLGESILKKFVRKQSQEIIAKYSLDDKVDQAKCIAELQALPTLSKDSWRAEILDLSKLALKPTPRPLIQRGEEGLIYRGDVHMISGAPGAMKSKFAMCIAAAALNNGQEAQHTLGMYATVQGLRVAYIDTELNEDTIRLRLPTVEAMCGRAIYKQEYLAYIPLRKYSKAKRLRTIYAIIQNGGYDLIIIDGLRDIALDFNDAREASELSDLFKRLAESSNAAIIVTSHTSKGTDYSRGHLGSQFKDEAGLEIVLKKTAASEKVDVECTKSRHSLPSNFSFRQVEHNMIEIEAAIDMSELSRSRRNAWEVFSKYLTPGQEYTYTEIVEILKEHGISASTTRKYLSEGKGRTINYLNSRYSLPERNLLNDKEDDLPEG